MKQMKTYKLISVMAGILLLSLALTSANYFGNQDTASKRDQSSSAISNNIEEATWIVKWKNDQRDPKMYEQSRIIEEDKELQITIVQPKEGIKEEAWLEAWQNSECISYIQPNQQVRIEAVPNDPLYQLQEYLKDIQIEQAWDVQKSNTDVTIAVVDTGVDLNHPDLKSSLVKGQNLFDEAKPPQDDNGHGTKVAGVIGAGGNNSRGVSGVLWGSKIMPIKALAEDGYGDESKLGQGIRYAVDHDADIIVLSVGLYKKSVFLSDVVKYAESNGVLIVAASGNDGQRAVKYPAAYPTVLAVGGINENKQKHYLSNYGQEIDVVAPWRVYTTALGGDYAYEEGTSMAAPQVAAVAALIKKKYPALKPFEIRNHIRSTAERLGSESWNNHTGYGLLRADQALSGKLVDDFSEPDDSIQESQSFPVSSMVSGSITSSADMDWFHYSFAYSGSIKLSISTVNAAHISRLQLVYYEKPDSEPVVYRDVSAPIRLPLKPSEKSYFRLEDGSGMPASSITYRIQSEFLIAADAYENNDRQYIATELPVRDQTVTGTFHQQNDFDWYALDIQQPGTLRATLSTDSYRIDPELLIVDAATDAAAKQPLDSADSGKTEYLPSMDVFPGKYYIRVRNAIAPENVLSTDGQYILNLIYNPKLIDPNEPNNRSFQSTNLSAGSSFKGVIESENDEDWFMMKINEESLVSIVLSDIPETRMMSLSFMDQEQNEISLDVNKMGQQKLRVESILQKGTYYIRLKANEPFQNRFYQISYQSTPATAGLTDIEGHWAEEEIVQLVETGIVTGYEDYQFKPNRFITRAEAVMMLSNAFATESSAGSTVGFSDIAAGHWAYEAIQTASAAGWIRGYPDQTFRPGQSLSRVEMAVLASKVLGVKLLDTDEPPFEDIPDHHWALRILATLKQQGWVSGYPDGTFKPNQTASRAEFSYLLYQLYQQAN